MEDRPREKLLARGKKALTDAELLAILLGCGSQGETAVSLSQRILQAIEHDLHALGKCSIQELTYFKGVGEAKAIRIAAALELGRRRQITQIRHKPQVRSSKEAHQLIAPPLMDLQHEEFWILMLNRANRAIGRERISSGGVAGTVVDAKIVFRKALENSACAIILAHNHPSGNLMPSKADINLTHKLLKAGSTLDIAVLDHLIITDHAYCSLADEGMMS